MVATQNKEASAQFYDYLNLQMGKFAEEIKVLQQFEE